MLNIKVVRNEKNEVYISNFGVDIISGEFDIVVELLYEQLEEEINQYMISIINEIIYRLENEKIDKVS